MLIDEDEEVFVSKFFDDDEQVQGIVGKFFENEKIGKYGDDDCEQLSELVVVILVIICEF